MMQPQPASCHLSLLKSSVLCCGLYRGSALATSPNISSGFFSPLILKNKIIDPKVFICDRFSWPMFIQLKLHETVSSVQNFVSNTLKSHFSRRY